MAIKITLLKPIGAGIGDISAAGITLQQSQEIAEAVSRLLVPVDPSTPSRCIDGRHCTGTLAREEADKHITPRPSVAGGANVSGYAAAEMIGDWFENNNAQIADRLAQVDMVLREHSVFPGGHVDALSVADGYENPVTHTPKTGCGADDRLVDILNRLDDHNEIIMTYVSALLGSDYNEQYGTFIDHTDLQHNVMHWNPAAALQIITDQSEGKNVEVLEGSNAEVLVVFNFLKNTTLDRDRFIEETNHQVFVVDMWYIDKMSYAMAYGRPAATKLQSRLKHAMVAYQIATYLTLCDGTQRPVLFQPEDNFVTA